jgi:hypothetical protein
MAACRLSNGILWQTERRAQRSTPGNWSHVDAQIAAAPAQRRASHADAAEPPGLAAALCRIRVAALKSSARNALVTGRKHG